MPSDFTAWHRAVFERAFPGRCGELRDHDEESGFLVGTREKPVLKVGRRTGWRRVPKRLA